MPKITAPLLSLHAGGTIADTITFTHTNRQDIAKSIPTHPDAQTLPQFYQRTSFTDARFYWASLSQTQKDAFRDQPYPQHLTPQQKAIRYYLRYLPDLSAAWSFDSLTANQAKDRSKNALHLTTNFTTTDLGLIDRAAYFDGIDDKAWIADNPALRPNTGLTITFFIKHRGWTSGPRILSKDQAGQECYYLRFYTTGHVVIEMWKGGGGSASLPSLSTCLTQDTWYHLAITWTPAIQWAIFINGLLDRRRTDNMPITMKQGTSPLYIPIATYSSKATLDDLRIYNRALSDAHIAFLATQQRYPPPLP